MVKYWSRWAVFNLSVCKLLIINLYLIILTIFSTIGGGIFTGESINASWSGTFAGVSSEIFEFETLDGVSREISGNGAFNDVERSLTVWNKYNLNRLPIFHLPQNPMHYQEIESNSTFF